MTTEKRHLAKLKDVLDFRFACTLKTYIIRALSSFWSACLSLFQYLKKDPITLFTGLLVLVGMFHACAFIQSERASVIPTKAYFAKKPAAHDKTVSIIVEMKNGGKSTATIEVLQAFISHELASKPEYLGGTSFAISPILPGGMIERRLEFLTEWGQDYVDRLNSGDLKLYFYGFLRYRDGFSSLWMVSKERETGFCFEYLATGGVSDAVFETCRERLYTYTR